MPILQIKFTFDLSLSEYENLCRSVAPLIAGVSGLRWKVWVLNEQEREAGGIYLFATEQEMNDYVAGPFVGKLKSHPAIRNVRIAKFEVMEDLTSITRGPVAAAAAMQ